MSKHVWKDGMRLVEVGFDRGTDNFFLTVNTRTVHMPTFRIMTELCRRSMKIPINLTVALESDKEFEAAENTNLPTIDYGYAPKFLKEHHSTIICRKCIPRGMENLYIYNDVE